MAYMDPTYRQRALCTVVTTGTGSTVNVQLTVPQGLDALWDVIDASGYGVRVTSADGETALTYDVSSFTLATRTMVIDIEAVPTNSNADRAVAFWLYFDPSSAASDGSGAPSTTSQLTGYLEIGKPSTHVLAYKPVPRTRTTPSVQLQKTVDDRVHVWTDYTAALERPARPYRQRQHYEEVWEGGYNILDSGGASVPGMIEAASLRWVSYRDGESRRERVALRAVVKSGTDGSSYTLEQVARTIVPGGSSVHRALAMRAALDTTDLEVS